MTDKKKPPESSDKKSRDNFESSGGCQSVVQGDGAIGKQISQHYVDGDNVIITKSKLPEPTEPPPPIVAKPKR